MSNSDQVALLFDEESTFGTASVGAYQYLRFTNESLEYETETVESAEIRNDRNTPDVIRVAVRAVGDINFELSYGTYDEFFRAGLFSGAWSTPGATQTSTTGDLAISAVASTYTSASDCDFTEFTVNQWIFVSDPSSIMTAGNRGFKKVNTVLALVLTVDSPTTMTTESPTGGSVLFKDGSQIVNGTTNTNNFFTIEKWFSELGNGLISDGIFERFTGMKVSGFTLDVNEKSVITGAFSFLGQKGLPLTATASASQTAVTTTDIMNVVDTIHAVFEGKHDDTTPFASYDASAFSVSVDNNLRERNQLGELYLQAIGSGKFKIEGSITAHFADSTVRTKYAASTPTALVVVFVDTDANAYLIDFPNIKYTACRSVAGGQNSYVMQECPFIAYMDPDEEIAMRIVKWAA